MGYLSNRSTAELYAFLNNGDGTMLSEDARRELASRGDLPTWAAAPSNVDANLDAAATPIPPDPSLGGGRPKDRVPADPEDYRFETRTGVVGPRTDDGRKPRLAPTFRDAEEAAEYYVRPRNPETGELMPSRADEAMMARGFVPVYTPDGDVSYSMASDYDGSGGVADQMSPSARRRASTYVGHNVRDGAGAVHENVRIGADNRPIYDPLTGKPKPASHEPVWVRTPFGERQVLRLTDEARQAQASARNEAAADRVAARIGANPEDLIDPAKRGRALRQNYERDQEARRNRVASMAMLAGGSQNINSGNRWMFNALLELPPEQRAEALQQMLPMNPVRAQVEAAQLDAAARLAQRAITGALAGQGQVDPMKIREEQRMDHLRGIASKAANGVWFKDFAYEAAEEALMNEGADADQRRAILEDLFGPGAGDAKPAGAPASGSEPPSRSQYFPGQAPAPPPRNPLAAPRPFG